VAEIVRQHGLGRARDALPRADPLAQQTRCRQPGGVVQGFDLNRAHALYKPSCWVGGAGDRGQGIHRAPTR
jgi:hypothetical protein